MHPLPSYLGSPQVTPSIASAVSESVGASGGPPVSAAGTAPFRAPSHLPVRPLSPAACQQLLGDQKVTVWRAYSFITFLESNDPAVTTMTPEQREALKAQAQLATDTRYLEDQWPDVGTGLAPFPAHRPIPAFTTHHQEQALEHATAVAAVALACKETANARLKTFLEPVQNELIRIDTLLSALPTHHSFPARDHAIELVRRLEQHRSVHDGWDCRIAKDVSLLTTPRRPVSLKATREALEELMQLRRGYDGNLTDLSAEKQPAFRARWDRMHLLLKQDDLSAFHRELAAMKRWRTQLLCPTLESFYSPMPAEDLTPE